MYRSGPLCSTLNTNVNAGLDMCNVCTKAVITGLDMWKVCTEALHCVALWTQTLSQVWTCGKYVPKQLSQVWACETTTKTTTKTTTTSSTKKPPKQHQKNNHHHQKPKMEKNHPKNGKNPQKDLDPYLTWWLFGQPLDRKKSAKPGWVSWTKTSRKILSKLVQICMQISSVLET